MDQPLFDMLFGAPNLTPAERARQESLARQAALRGDNPPQPPMPQPPMPQPPMPQPPMPQGSMYPIPDIPMPQTAPQRPQAAPGGPALPRAMGSQPPGVPAQPAAPAGPDLLMQRHAELQKRQAEAMAGVESAYQPVDRSGAEAAYQRNAKEGGQGLLMALAAQEAGKEFAPIGAHYLKRASEAQSPMKMAGGTMTQSGFIEDPGYNQNLAVQRADAKLRQIDQALQQNLTEQERRRLQVEQERAADERQAALLESRRDIATIAAAAKGTGQSGVDQDRRFRGEDRMKNDFEQVTKSAREGHDAARQAQVVLSGATGRKLSNVEQQALITLFNKFLDPDSVVREGEYNRMAAGMGLAQRITNWQDKIMSGSVITPQMAQEIGRVANVYQNDAAARVRQNAAEYEKIAGSRQYDPGAVITNPTWRGSGGSAMPEGAVRPKGAPTAAPAPAQAGPPPGAVRERK
jgi:hypothetical protein